MDKETGVPTDKLAPDALFVGSQIGSSITTCKLFIYSFKTLKKY
jgi:hypothetical protein